MGFFRGIGDFFREVNDFRKELTDIAKEGAEDLTEIATDGFKEMVIKGNSDYKTSNEKKEIARQTVAAARADVEDAIESVKAKATLVEQAFARNQQSKTQLLDVCNHDLVQSATTFKQMKLEFGNFQKQLTSSFQSSLSGALLPFGIITSQGQRVAAANQMLEDAKRFEAQAEVQVERLKHLRLKLETIISYLDDEQRVLHHLEQLLAEKVQALNAKMSQGFQSEQLVEESAQILQTAEMIGAFAKVVECIDADLNVKTEYKDLLNKLKTVEQTWSGA
jgi:hypothetical protein